MSLSTAFLALALAGGVGFAAADSACQTLIDTISGAGLQALTDAVTAATPNLLTTSPAVAFAATAAVSVPAGQRFTVFAPTDTAFAAVQEQFGGDLPTDVLTDVLLNHIVPQELTAEIILTQMEENDGSISVFSLLGSELFVTTDGTDIFVQSAGIEAPGATVTSPDQTTCVGPVHVIDTVLLPETLDGTVIPFPEPSTVIGPVISPLEVPAPAPVIAPGLAPTPVDTELISGSPLPAAFVEDFGPDQAPGLVIVDDTGLGPVEGPVAVSTRGLGPIGFVDDYDLEPSSVTPEVIAVLPLGDEPSEGPIEAVLDGPEGAEGPDGAEGPEGSEGLAETVDGIVPTVQAETASALSSFFFSSTLTGAIVALIALMA